MGKIFGVSDREVRAYSIWQSVIDGAKNGNTISIYWCGDSLTYGRVDTSTAQVTTPMPARVQQYLRSYYGNSSTTCYNSGVSLSLTSTVASQVIAALAASPAPSLIMINGGLEDAKEANSRTLDAYTTDLRTAFAATKAASVPVIVWNLPPRFKEPGSNNGEKRLQMFRARLEEVAADYGYPVIDIYSFIMSIYESGAYTQGQLSADGQHGSQLYYDLWAGYVFSVLCLSGRDRLNARKENMIPFASTALVPSASLSFSTAFLPDPTVVLPASSTQTLYLFVEEWQHNVLVLDAFIYDDSGTSQEVTVTNTMLVSSGGAAAGVTVKMSLGALGSWSTHTGCVPFPTTKLGPGLNIVTIVTAASKSARIARVGIQKVAVKGLENAKLQFCSIEGQQFYNDLYGGATMWNNDGTAARQMLPNPIAATVDNARVPVCWLEPGDLHQKTIYRINGRGVINRSIYFGQMRTDPASATRVQYLWKLAVTSTVTLTCRKFDGTDVSVATAAIGTLFAGSLASPENMSISIVSDTTGFSIYINDVLFASMPVPFTRGPFVISRSTSGVNMQIDKVYDRNPNATVTGRFVTEEWYDHVNDRAYRVNAAGTQKYIALT
jgi:lysophospholipase L1-like esterase